VRLRPKHELPPSQVPGWDTDFYGRVVQRVKHLDEYTMIQWADIAGTGMAQGFADYQKHSTVESLDEIKQGLQQLWAVAQELSLRYEAALEVLEHTPGA
jgi:hypothetical protein